MKAGWLMCVGGVAGALKVKEVVVAHTAPNVAGVLFAGSATQNASSPAAGRLLPHVEAKLVDGGKAVKSGASGKLYVRGYTHSLDSPLHSLTRSLTAHLVGSSLAVLSLSLSLQVQRDTGLLGR